MSENNLFQSGTKFVGGGVLSVCRECVQPFLCYTKNTAKTCPKCSDVKQLRPSIVETREELFSLDGIKITSLPGEWVKYKADYETDYPCYKIDLSGSRFGTSWNGRIVIYATHEFKVGNIVRLREMLATHKTKTVTSSHKNLEGDDYQLTKETPITSADGEETVLSRPYLVLERSERSTATSELISVEAYSKTTLKGFGRQFSANLGGSPIRHWEISGAARSGRFSTTFWLAIVDNDHPVIRFHTENDQTPSKIYPSCETVDEEKEEIEE